MAACHLPRPGCGVRVYSRWLTDPGTFRPRRWAKAAGVDGDRTSVALETTRWVVSGTLPDGTRLWEKGSRAAHSE